MEIKQLETFCKVAELGSFSRAAEVIHLAQPTVSAQVASLERVLGTKLFDRLGRQVNLTPAGRMFYQYARRILRLRQEAINALMEFNQSLAGEISIGASTIPGEYVLPRLLGAFSEDFPSLRVNLKIGDSEEILELLGQEEIELAIVGMKGKGKGVEFVPLFSDRVIIIAPKGHPLAGKEVGWERLKGEPFILRERGSGTRKAFEEGLGRKGLKIFDLRIVATMGSTSSVKEGVKAGLGLGIVSDLAVADELGRGLEEVKLKDGDGISRTFWLALGKGRTLSPLAQQFYRFLLRSFEGRKIKG